MMINYRLIFPNFLNNILNNRTASYLLLAILSIIWGSSFILMKEGLKTLSGVQVAALRISVGGLIFAPIIIRHIRKIKKKDLRFVLLAGVIGNGIPAFLFAIAQTKVDSAMAGVLNGLTPFFTLVIGAAFSLLIVTRDKVVGVIIGLLGATAIVLGKDIQHLLDGGFSAASTLTFSPYIFLIVLATIGYGANINLIKTKLSGYQAFSISAIPLFFISIPGLFIFLSSDTSVLADLSSNNQTIKSVGAVVILALFGNSLSLIMFNKLIQMSGPFFAASVTYFIPVVALLWGLLDGESFVWMQLVGFVLVIAGVYLVNKRVSPKPN
ncbi:MAG: drug/metabolite transporter (DMT)-like permease [Bacteroidia bacterium]|jgi:drug/metabolite transporter (DMT)-like permease